LDRYEDLDELYRRPPDALIVTGSEPLRTDLREEAQWPHLSRLVRWAVGATVSAVFSCLAAHAALLELSGVERRLLPRKASGVFDQLVRRGHPLTAGLGPVACPHSRYNEVPTAAVVAAGFDVLLGSPAVGWTMAVAEKGGLVVLLQGHPEYEPTTLLREYRRDVGRYLAGRRATHPDVPAGYLDAEGVALLDGFRRAAEAGTARDEFPFEVVAGHLAVDWRPPMVRLFGNWLTEVEARKLRRTWRRAG
jgi:homoserine O-succinyltransferase